MEMVETLWGKNDFRTRSLTAYISYSPTGKALFKETGKKLPYSINVAS
jgi:hypothetical protein